MNGWTRERLMRRFEDEIVGAVGVSMMAFVRGLRIFREDELAVAQKRYADALATTRAALMMLDARFGPVIETVGFGGMPMGTFADDSKIDCDDVERLYHDGMVQFGRLLQDAVEGRRERPKTGAKVLRRPARRGPR